MNLRQPIQTLQIQTPFSMSDDGDSGIHGSNEAFESNNILKLNQNSNLVKSNSAHCLIQRKRSFSLNWEKCQKSNRNYSVDIGNKSIITSPYKLMIFNDVGKPVLIKNLNRNSMNTIALKLTEEVPINSRCDYFPVEKALKDEFWNSLCQVDSLLILMKLGLGLSMLLFGIYLKHYSKSINTKDCGYWASSVLLISGLTSMYYLNERWQSTDRRFNRIYKTVTILLSMLSCTVTMTASIYSGSHSNWITLYAHPCFGNGHHDNTYHGNHVNLLFPNVVLWPQFCCYDSVSQPPPLPSNYLSNHTNAGVMCNCLATTANNQTLQRTYLGIKCKALFSSIKDYLVLVCSLMAVASGCELWFVVNLIRCSCCCRCGKPKHGAGVNSQLPSNNRPVDDNNAVGQIGNLSCQATTDRDYYPPSPIIPFCSNV